MNAIEHALREYRRSPEGSADETAAVLNALPVYRGWTGTVYLNTSGQFLFRDEEESPSTIREEKDPHTQIVALVEGAERFPVLANLLPGRPVNNDTCQSCHGTGRFVPRNATGWLYCPECHGLGWSGRVDIPLPLHELGSIGAPYVAFDDALEHFQELVRRQGISAKVMLVRREDIMLFRDRTYVHPGSETETYAAVRRQYDNAVRRRLGVGLEAVCRLRDGRVVAYVYGPENSDEAERLMYPDGVRYSVPLQLREGVLVSAPVALLLRLSR